MKGRKDNGKKTAEVTSYCECGYKAWGHGRRTTCLHLGWPSLEVELLTLNSQNWGTSDLVFKAEGQGKSTENNDCVINSTVLKMQSIRITRITPLPFAPILLFNLDKQQIFIEGALCVPDTVQVGYSILNRDLGHNSRVDQLGKGGGSYSFSVPASDADFLPCSPHYCSHCLRGGTVLAWWCFRKEGRNLCQM